MTRRDMAIIAILVNTGLLAILFMMAINSDSDVVNDPPAAQPQITEVAITPPVLETESTPAPQPIAIEEGDNALKDFNVAPAPLPILAEEINPETETDETAEDTAKQDKPKAEAVAEAQEPEKKMVEVTVKRGDSLDKIARANGTTIKAIKDANNLKSSRLDIGQVLKVPVGSKKKAESTAGAKTAKKPSKASDNKEVASSDQEYYVIKKGDNPWKIARQFHIKVDDLLKLNNMSEEKARNLKAGDRIRVK